MQKQQIDLMSGEQKALVSVAYLMSNPELQPEESKKYFDKLNVYDDNARNIQDAMKQAQKSIQELKPKLEQTIGAITAMSSIIAEMIPAEKFEEYCLAYQVPEGVNPNALVAPKKPDNVVDFAGSTAKKLPDPKQA
jgi:hypothetical protein